MGRKSSVRRGAPRLQTRSWAREQLLKFPRFLPILAHHLRQLEGRSRMG
jgi:hypothetical protein